jgi:lysophospholipase L1-like esterase
LRGAGWHNPSTFRVFREAQSESGCAFFFWEYNCVMMIRKYGLGLFLFLTACSSVSHSLAPQTPAVTTIRYLALGDSYTIGESVAEEERWPNQLAERLRAETRFVEVTIIARTGWTTDELWQGIRARTIDPPYDLVSLLIGVNNQYRGYSINEYREQFVFLLNRSIEYAGGDSGRVIVLSIPDWGVTPFAEGRDRAQIAKEIDAFNAVNREETEKAGARYVDITPVSRQAANDATLLASDGLHPSGKMYAAWVDLALPVVLESLEISK